MPMIWRWRGRATLDGDTRPAMTIGGSDHDPILSGIYAARRDSARLDATIEDILTRHAMPMVSKLLATWVSRGTVTPSELPDIEGEIALRLVRKLRRMADDPGTEPIS